jgi:hypothetical protein
MGLMGLKGAGRGKAQGKLSRRPQVGKNHINGEQVNKNRGFQNSESPTDIS